MLQDFATPVLSLEHAPYALPLEVQAFLKECLDQKVRVEWRGMPFILRIVGAMPSGMDADLQDIEDKFGSPKTSWFRKPDLNLKNTSLRMAEIKRRVAFNKVQRAIPAYLQLAVCNSSGTYSTAFSKRTDLEAEQAASEWGVIEAERVEAAFISWRKKSVRR